MAKGSKQGAQATARGLNETGFDGPIVDVNIQRLHHGGSGRPQWNMMRPDTYASWRPQGRI
jgi:hypothetical protein